MSRAILTVLAAAALASPGSAYTLRFSPDPAYVEQARVVVTLDYYDVFTCADASLKRLQPPRTGVIRLQLGRGLCDIPPADAQHSTSITLPELAAGSYQVEIVEAGVWPVDPFVSDTLRVFEPSPCRPDDHTLCLHGGRFAVQVDWRDFADHLGGGQPVPLDRGQPFTPDTGFFWFFDPDNLELMAKVLDGCALNGHFWVFLSPASTVEYQVRVTDQLTGAERTYHNASGAIPSLTADTDAFPCS